MKRDLVALDHPALRQVAEDVGPDNCDDAELVAMDLVDTIMHTGGWQVPAFHKPV